MWVLAYSRGHHKARNSRLHLTKGSGLHTKHPPGVSPCRLPVSERLMDVRPRALPGAQRRTSRSSDVAACLEPTRHGRNSGRTEEIGVHDMACTDLVGQFLFVPPAACR